MNFQKRSPFIVTVSAVVLRKRTLHQVESQQKKLKNKSAEVDRLKTDLEHHTLGQHGCRSLSIRGGYALGIKRQTGFNVGGEALAIILEVGAAQNTANRWEIKSSDALCAHTRAYYRTCDEVLSEAAMNGEYCFRVLGMKGDATNSDVFQHSKVQTLEIRCSYYAGGQDLLENYNAAYDLLDLLESHTYWADVLVVEDSTGEGCFSLVAKQLQNAGVQKHIMFDEVLPDEVEDAYTYCSDGGPDQKWFRARLYECAVGADSYFFDSDCLKHHVHIMVKNALRRTDQACKTFQLPYSYFSTVAKWMNWWRTTGNAKKIQFQWESRYGCHSALKYVSRMPGRCLDGRWQAIDECEKFVLKTPLHAIETQNMPAIAWVMAAAMDNNQSSKTSKTGSNDASDLPAIPAILDANAPASEEPIPLADVVDVVGEVGKKKGRGNGRGRRVGGRGRARGRARGSDGPDGADKDKDVKGALAELPQQLPDDLLEEEVERPIAMEVDRVIRWRLPPVRSALRRLHVERPIAMEVDQVDVVDVASSTLSVEAPSPPSPGEESEEMHYLWP